MGRMKLTVLKYSNLVEVATNKLKGILSHYEHEPSNKELLTLVEEVVFSEEYICKIEYGELLDIIDAIYLRVASKYSILKQYLDDPKINEIMVNGADHIFVEKNKHVLEVDNAFYSPGELESLIRMFA